MTPKKITLIVLTYNEEIHLARCLGSCTSLNPDIIIVDSGSGDNTLKIAKKYGATVYTHPFVSQARQLIWALETIEITTEWILRLDADEYLSPSLASEILAIIGSLHAPDGYLLPRRMIFNNTWIKHGGIYPTYILRLWKSRRATVVNTWMDEHIVLNSGGPGKCDNYFTDHNLKGLAFWVQKHNSYSTREVLKIDNEASPIGIPAQGLFSPKVFLKGLVHGRAALYVRSFLNFIIRYFCLFGFLDGKNGFVFHVLHSFWYRFLVDAKLDEASISENTNLMQFCIACGDSQRQKKLRGLTLLKSTAFGVNICKSCGLGTTFPMPNITADYYLRESGYASSLAASRHISLYSAMQILKTAFDMDPFLRYLTTTPSSRPTALDVGCGSGAMIEVLQRHNFVAQGIEANYQLSCECSARGLDVFCGDVFKVLTQMHSESRKYDLIVLSSILEHVKNPEHLLACCRQLLKPNGRILLSQSFYAGLVPSLLPFLWYAWVPHEHYYHFTVDSLRLIGRKAGLSLSMSRLDSLYHFPRSGMSISYYMVKSVVYFLSIAARLLGKGDHLIALLLPSNPLGDRHFVD